MLCQIIESSGGIVEGSFVLKPGVMVLSRTVNTSDANDLYALLNLGMDVPDYEVSAEFASRITYMNFPGNPPKAREYNKRMIEQHGHYSVHASHVVTFLIAGISTDASMELIAHREATVARFTTNRTKAQVNPLFVLRGNAAQIEAQKEYFKYLPTRGDLVGDMPDDLEIRNRLLPAKATALTFTMSVKDFHKTLIGRLSHTGVEEEVRNVFESMCTILHDLYPLVIRDADWYYNQNNAAKYQEF